MRVDSRASQGCISAAGARLANAVADPGAVVVELADAVVADGAVRAARRPVVVAGVAPLRAHCEPVHVVLSRLHTPAPHQNRLTVHQAPGSCWRQ